MSIPACAELGFFGGGRCRDRKRSGEREQESEEEGSGTAGIGNHGGGLLRKRAFMLATPDPTRPRVRVGPLSEAQERRSEAWGESRLKRPYAHEASQVSKRACRERRFWVEVIDGSLPQKRSRNPAGRSEKRRVCAPERLRAGGVTRGGAHEPFRHPPTNRIQFDACSFRSANPAGRFPSRVPRRLGEPASLPREARGSLAWRPSSRDPALW